MLNSQRSQHRTISLASHEFRTTGLSTLHTHGKKKKKKMQFKNALTSGLKVCQDDKMPFSELEPEITELTFSILGLS